MKIQIKRVYEKPSQDDGFRMLVDRIWPRGLNKEKAQLDQWIKDIAPSTPLRKWFDHKENRFNEFSKKYIQELESSPELIGKILEVAHEKPLTLVYSAKDENHNQAIVLKNYLQNHQIGSG